MLPNSHLRTFWDTLSVLFLSYDCVMIPLYVFGIGIGGDWRPMEFLVSMFWTLDIVMSFFTGYYTLYGVELRPAMIARGYVFRGTFCFDIVIVLIDWLISLSEMLAGDAFQLARLGKFVRFGRGLRLLRLLRILKIPAALEHICDAIQSKAFTTGVGILQSVGLIIIANHFVACVFYALSNSLREDFSQPAWVDQLYAEERATLYFYFTALHWSVTQFTPASMEVQPRNSSERIFAVVIVFTALMVFSSFVSGITTSMTSLREFNKHRDEQLQLLRKYIIDKKLSMDLSHRISTFIQQHQFLTRRTPHEQDIEVFALIPAAMRLQLRWEAHSPTLIRVPFLFQVNDCDWEVFLEICNTCLVEQPWAPARDVFLPAHEAQEMLFLMAGHVDYVADEEQLHKFQAPRMLARPSGSASEAPPDPVFCQASLWIHYRHSGRLSCVSAVEILAMSTEAFRKVVKQNAGIDMLNGCCIYARAFFQMLMASDEISWDLPLQFDDQQEMAQRAFGGVPGCQDRESPQLRRSFNFEQGVKLTAKKRMKLFMRGSIADKVRDDNSRSSNIFADFAQG
jgi:hypothetical protein